MTNAEREQKIRAAIARAQADGWIIFPHRMTSRIGEAKTCCALGAILAIGKDIEDELEIFIDSPWARDFFDGFDGSDTEAIRIDPDAYAMGQRLREEFCK